jgi:hypothetical protein
MNVSEDLLKSGCEAEEPPDGSNVGARSRFYLCWLAAFIRF